MTTQSWKNESLLGLQRSEDYYLPGGDLYCIAEGRLFRVHKYFFERESTFFKIQLAIPATPGATRIGTTEDSAILLDNVRSVDFSKLLWVFYNPKYSLYDATVEDWSTILELAQRWQFAEVKNLAVRELEKLWMSEVDRIVLYHKFEVDEKLLIPRYMALCERPELLTVDEGLLLGMKTVIALTRARECVRSPTVSSAGAGWRSPSPTSIGEKEMTDIIKDHFSIKDEPVKPAGEPVPTGAKKADDSGTATGDADAGTTNGATGATNGTAGTTNVLTGILIPDSAKEPESPATGKSGDSGAGAGNKTPGGFGSRKGKGAGKNH